MIDRLKRGIAAGGAAGAAYGLFTWLVVSPFVGYMEHAAAHDGGNGHGHAYLVSETTSGVVSTGGGVLWGVLLGAAFGVAYYLFEPTLPGGDLKAYVLAGVGFLIVSVVPWTVLPPAVPGMEQLYGPGVRVPLYVGLMGLGAAVAAASVLAYRRVDDARGRAAGVLAAAVPLAGLALLSIGTPPMLVGGEAPPDLAAAFQWLVVFSQAGLWVVLAAGFRRFDGGGDRHAANATATAARATE